MANVLAARCTRWVMVYFGTLCCPLVLQNAFGADGFEKIGKKKPSRFSKP